VLGGNCLSRCRAGTGYCQFAPCTSPCFTGGNKPTTLKWHAIGVFTTPGGLPIVAGGQMIGTIGIGGGSKDEEMSFEALEAVVGP
jgi:heme-degrading protein